MKESDSEERSFWREILRRRVFSTAAAYAVGGWGIIEVADIVAPAFNAPEWTLRVLTTLLILAFPLIVVIAWEFDITLRGLRKTDSDLDRGITATHWFRRTLVALISAASIGSIWWVWSSGVLVDSTFASKDSDKFPKIIAVDGLKTIGAEGEEWLGDGVANLVRDNLSQSDYLRVVSLRRWRAISKDRSADELLEAASAAGIRYLVQGEVISNRKGHVLTVRLTDTSDGEQLDAETYEVSDEGTLLDRATAIAQRTRAMLKVPMQERVDVFAADFAADNPGAYRAFVAALDYWINFEFSAAEKLLRGSLELQPDYAMARYYLAWVLAVQDRRDDALEVLAEAGASDALSERDRQYVAALTLLLQREAQASVEAYEELVSAYPSDTEARHLLAEAYEQKGDQASALSVYRSISQLEPEIHHGWSGLAYLNVMLGNYEDARPAIEKFAALAPDNPNVFVLRGDLNRAEGRFSEAIRDYRIAVEKGPELQEAVVSLAKTQHLMGDPAAAVNTLDDLIRDQDAVPRYRIEAAFAAGGILNAMGKISQHVAYLDMVDGPLRASGIFLSKALADKATARLNTEGPNAEIAALIDLAIASWSGVPTRYLFARGLFELASGDLAAVEVTAREIRGHALPADDPDRTEDMAADYLLGLAALQSGNNEAALGLLERATSVEGHQYRNYALAHAQALAAAGELDAARLRLRSIVTSVDPSSPRLDLELDRQLARLALAKIDSDMGQAVAARARLAELEKQWSGADQGFVWLEELRKIRAFCCE